MKMAFKCSISMIGISIIGIFLVLFIHSYFVTEPDKNFSSFEVIDSNPVSVLNTNYYRIKVKVNPSSIQETMNLDLTPGFFNLRGDDTPGTYIDNQGRKQYFIIGHKEYRRMVESQIEKIIKDMKITGEISIPANYLDGYYKAASIAHRNRQAGLAIIIAALGVAVLLSHTSLLSLVISYASLAGLNIYFVLKEGNLAYSIINLIVPAGIVVFSLSPVRSRLLSIFRRN